MNKQLPKHLIRVLLIAGLGLFALGDLSAQQTHQSATQCQAAYGQSLTFDLKALPLNCGGAILRVNSRGDINASDEVWTITDELGIKIGTTRTGTSCRSSFNATWLTIDDTMLTRWTRDGKTSFTVTPSNTVDECGPENNCTSIELDYFGKTSGYDVWVQSIDSPATNTCVGSHEVYATITNLGNRAIDSTRIFWTVGGVAQTPVKAVVKLDTCGSTNSSTAQIKLGTASFNGLSEIRVWSGFPNGSTDANTSNDTTRRTVAPQLRGTYSIGSTGADYQNIHEAVDALSNFGVCGPVLFNVANGTYSGQVVINQIRGAGHMNTITFRGQDSSQTIITHTGGRQNYATLHLLGADYCSFEKMTIRTTASTDGWCVRLSNDARHNQFHNCRIEMSLGTIDLIGFVASGSGTSETSEGPNAFYTTINNNIIVGGERGVHFEGRFTLLGRGNVFTNNLIDSPDDYGFYFDDQDSIVISGNTVENIRSSLGDALTIYDSENFDISNNRFTARDYGIYINDGNFNGAGRARIINNVVNAPNDYALYLDDVRDVDLYHNTLYGRYGVRFDDYQGIDARNNIFVGNRNYPFWCDQSTGFTHLDNNVYYRTNVGTIARYDNTNYNSIEDWIDAVPTFNASSFDDNPPFVSGSDLRLNKNVVFHRGPDLGITEDNAGDPRCTFIPSIGAYESKYVDPVASASISVPDTVWFQNPAVFQSNYNGNAAVHKWYIDDTLVSTESFFTTSRNRLADIELKYILRSCSGIDSIIDTIPVSLPNRAPVANFISDKNSIFPFESISLTDLSDYGPTSWKYTVSPDSIFDPDIGANVATYIIAGKGRVQTLDLLYPGTYDVKQVVSNLFGADSITKSKYIEVRKTASMCSAEESTEIMSGVLYDNGGPNGNYSSGLNGTRLCTYTIRPCAQNMRLTFDEFVLSGGDFLRIYEGTDNTGKPLYNTQHYPSGLTGNTVNVNFPDTIIADFAPIYIEFETNNIGTNRGFIMNWSGEPATLTAPSASMSIPDTICIDKDYTFEGSAIGKNVNYRWSIGFDNYLTKDANVNLSTAGTYTVNLEASNCGGADKISGSVVAVSSKSLPKFNLSTDITNPVVGDVVTLSTVAMDCNYDYNWRFEPATKAKLSGASRSTDEVVMVEVLDTGCVDVIVSVTNKLGTTIDTFTCYINAQKVCFPSTIGQGSDIGISRVQLNNIDNNTTIGESGYFSYVNDMSTDLSKGASYDLTVSRNTTKNSMTRAAWIDYNQDGDFDDVGELIGFENLATTPQWTLNFGIPKSAVTGATRMRIAATDAYANSLPCGRAKIGEYEDYRVFVRPDLIPAVITLTDGDTVKIERGYTWIEPGYTAIDNVDGNITPDVVVTHAVNNMVVDTYYVSYQVSDASNNSTTRTRVVIVTPDITPPIATLLGKTFDTLEVLGTYTDLGFNAIDTADQLNLITSVDLNDFDSSKLGQNTIVYTITDQSGNTTTLTRHILVQDTQDPVLTLNGLAIDTVEVFTPYTDLGVTATDNFWKPLQVFTLNNVNTRELGRYTIVYTVTDGSGNGPVTISRTVDVVDRQAPQAQLVGSNSITHQVNTKFQDYGVTASDNYDRQVTTTTSGSFYNTFANGFASDTGVFEIVYTVSDNSGNNSILTRTVNVIDEVAPEITLLGNPIVQIKRWDEYNDAGVDLSDNYYDNDDLVLDTLTDFTSQSEGVYYIQYRATDPSGNVALSATRTIFVGPNSLVESAEGVSISIFPNPSSAIANLALTLDKEEYISVELWSLQGKLIKPVYTGNMQKLSMNIDVSDLAAGTYLVAIKGASFNEKQILQVKR